MKASSLTGARVRQGNEGKGDGRGASGALRIPHFLAALMQERAAGWRCDRSCQPHACGTQQPGYEGSLISLPADTGRAWGGTSPCSSISFTSLSPLGSTDSACFSRTVHSAPAARTVGHPHAAAVQPRCLLLLPGPLPATFSSSPLLSSLCRLLLPGPLPGRPGALVLPS